MVIPCISWGGQWKCNKGLEKTVTAIERTALRGKSWKGRSPALMWLNVLSYKIHPGFQQDIVAVQYQVRKLRRQTIKGQPKTAQNIGRFKEICRKWGWRCMGGSVVHTPAGTMDMIYG